MMISKLAPLAMITFFAVPLSAEAAWNPVGTYNESYKCEESLAVEGYSNETDRNLTITRDKSKSQSYKVHIDIATCPTGHLCWFLGTGRIRGSTLYLEPERQAVEELADIHDDLRDQCRVQITPLEDGSVLVKELHPQACEALFLCGANTSISGKYQLEKKP